MRARWTPYTTALIFLEQTMRQERWHDQFMHPASLRHASPADRQALRTLVQAARTKQVQKEHRDATREWRRWLAEEANKGSKRAHAWMKNEPEEVKLGDLVLTLEQAAHPWKQLWQANSRQPPQLPTGQPWHLREEFVLQACLSSSPFKCTAHDSVSPWHLQYLPRKLWAELMHLLNTWHEAGDETDGNFGILYVLLPKGV
eukprot:6490946-Amphidinium_carterae.2